MGSAPPLLMTFLQISTYPAQCGKPTALELDAALMPAAVNTPVSSIHLRRRQRSTPSSTPDDPGAVAMPPGGINTSITDDFPTNFHVPSRRSVRRRLAAQPIGGDQFLLCPYPEDLLLLVQAFLHEK